MFSAPTLVDLNNC